MKVVMFAWGNPSRGDDAVGPWFADRFRSSVNSGFALVEDFQLQVEHLLDCREGELLLFVDACCDAADDFRFGEVQPSGNVSHTSHALSPEELLGHYQRVFSAVPPRAFQLAVPGRDFDLGQDMSPATRACCERAAQLLETLLAQPSPGKWQAQVTERADA